ncbi:MAG TPA: hypothetical protein VFR70_01570 [Flavobacterium sp.]|nr:hypothetical protein [Flavobacterium sp.]
MKMKSLLLYNDPASGINLEFLGDVALRFLKVLFRSDKKIRMAYAQQSSYYSLGKNYIILSYHFQNALWYKIGHATTVKRKLAVSAPDAPEVICIEVYGFFKKKTFKINISRPSAANVELAYVASIHYPEIAS